MPKLFIAFFLFVLAFFPAPNELNGKWNFFQFMNRYTGEVIPADTSRGNFNLIFKDSLLKGYDGCNWLTATCSIQAPNKILISHYMTTQRACLHTHTGNTFNKALRGDTVHYFRTGDTLTIYCDTVEMFLVKAKQ